ncbi:hypothetical protein ACOMHN_008335 [Nucella lapillus]
MISCTFYSVPILQDCTTEVLALRHDNGKECDVLESSGTMAAARIEERIENERSSAVCSGGSGSQSVISARTHPSSRRCPSAVCSNTTKEESR